MRDDFVKTEVLTLNKIDKDNYQFIIPSYQRPYVWSTYDVVKLFDDIKTACDANQNDYSYFIGTILSADIKQNNEHCFELIDGQQRTTTLMLICIAFKKLNIKTKLAELATYTPQDKNLIPRLQFAIREEVQRLLGALAEIDNYQSPSDDEIETNQYLKHINKALNTLKNKIENLSEAEAKKLGDFLYEHVQWVNNIMPEGTDLNRLFTAANSSGIQLEQTDILKAKLFKKISRNKKHYDALWLICEHLDDFLEANCHKMGNFNWKTVDELTFAQFEPEKLGLAEKEEAASPALDLNEKEELTKDGLTIDELFKKLENNPSPTDFEPKDKKLKSSKSLSIANFPLLLIHAYRIYLIKNKKEDISKEVNPDRLLNIFAPLIDSDEKEIIKFMHILWQTRYQFDKWVVKWLKDEEEPEAPQKLNIANCTFAGEICSREIKKDDQIKAIVLLQSVLHFTRESRTQYWLTPFLYKLIFDAKYQDPVNILELLEHIDNQLSLATTTAQITSFALAGDQPVSIDSWNKKIPYFEESRGVRFGHYWFQKLEYLLWKEIAKDQTILTDNERKKFTSYRITSKTSVEHVHPQNQQKQTNSISDNVLHSFGNLVLLTVSENSSYSDQDVDKKQIDFEKKDHFDSLKLFKIFKLKGNKDHEWDENKISIHQKEMIELLTKHYENDVKISKAINE